MDSTEQAAQFAQTTIVFTAYCITAFLVAVSMTVIAVGSSSKMTSQARTVLCLFHLGISVLLGALATGELTFLLPPLFAATGESLVFAGHTLYVRARDSGLLTQQHEHERLANIRLLQIDAQEPPTRLVPSLGIAQEESVPALFGDALVHHADLDYAAVDHAAVDHADLDYEEGGESELESTGLPEDCIFSVQRFQTDDSETLAGQARAIFLDSRLNESIHIAFCPPFDCVPVAEVFQSNGVAATIKTAMIEKFGMRIEVKRAGNAVSSLSNDCQPVVEIEFFVHAARKQVCLQDKFASDAQRQMGQAG